MGFATSYDCGNGLSIALPAGADEVTSVTSALPVLVSAAAGSSPGTAQFSLTATEDGGAFHSCQNFYQIDMLQPKQPFDLVFVLDKSGSMDNASSVGTRWDALRTGVETFLPFIVQAADLPTPAGSRMGLTFFDSGVAAISTPMFDILSGPGTPSPEFNNISNLLNLDPNGATAMGLGLQDGIAKANTPTNPKVVVLFSDGEQNRDPRIASDGCNYTSPNGPINPTCPGADDAHQIVTVGIGSPIDPYYSTLVNLGENNSGSALFTDNGSVFSGTDVVPGDIGATFTNSIGAALEGNSPQQIAYAGGLVQPDLAVPNALPAFDVNRSVDAVTLSFAFGQRFKTPNLLELFGAMQIAHNGSNVTAEFRPVLFGNSSDVLTLVRDARPAGGAPRDLEGSYDVTIQLPNSKYKPNLEFRMFAFAEDRRFRATATVDSAVPRVNAPINVDVQLSWLNLGLEGAEVVVRAFVPGADMGELLSGGAPVKLSEAPDAGNPGAQKYDQLVANDPGFLAALALSPNAIGMTDDGGGLYSGTFTLPDTVGAVHLVYDVAADTPDLHGKVQRRWYETIYARFDAIDMDNSDLVASWLDGNALQLDATFRRPSGALLGPGQINAFAIAGADVIERRDLQDGRYQFVIDVADADQEIKIALAGDEIYAGPAGWGKGPRTTLERFLKNLSWWAILLILLLILLVVWLLRRMFGPSTP